MPTTSPVQFLGWIAKCGVLWISAARIMWRWMHHINSHVGRKMCTRKSMVPYIPDDYKEDDKSEDEEDEEYDESEEDDGSVDDERERDGAPHQ